MGLRYPTKRSGLVLLAFAIGAAGCSDAVTLTRETETGGLVTYLFKEDRGGPMGSPHRKDAVRMMEKKCPSGYSVLKDGEVPVVRQYVQRGRAGGRSDRPALGDTVPL